MPDRTRIKVIPHFMRLHEWIILEEADHVAREHGGPEEMASSRWGT